MKRMVFSKGINKLEELIANIEDSDTSLENSIKLYKEAIDISLKCAESLNAMEKEVMLLQKTAEGVFEKKSFSQTEES